MTLLQQLWELAERETQKRGKSNTEVFYGLCLYKNLRNEGYDSTPINSTTFAVTGGDGVHFNLLHIDGEITDSSPVVMTVPMMFDKPNIILGENLYEFLCLGCEVGFFVLEEIAYNFWGKSAADWVRDEHNEMDDQEKKSLQTLIDELGLKRWTNVEARLDELEKQYLPLLQLKEDT